MSARVLIAGIGNLFLGDDGFGCEVARRLASLSLPPHVRAVDFGIRGFDLTFALLEDWERVILVDVARRGGAPGTLYVIEPDLHSVQEKFETATLDLHGMDPTRVLSLVRAMGGQLGWLRLVACEPDRFGSDDGEVAVGLSTPVAAAVDGAVEMVERLIDEVTHA